jgi:hypothetical protein
LRWLRRNLQNGGLTLEDIGTSEKELRQLRVEGCKIAAKLWLNALRREPDQYDNHLRWLRRNLQNGGLTLEDIGTSEKELRQLRLAATNK